MENTQFKAIDGLTAQEACTKVSSVAENITAAGNAVAGAVTAALSPLSRTNYKASNEVAADLKSITQLDFSSADINLMRSTCSNEVTNSQSNEISNKDCAYCQNVPVGGTLCSLEDVTQANDSSVEQSCILASMASIGSQKSVSADQASALKMAQTSQGLLSGNKVTSYNCTYLSVDASSKDYYEMLSECQHKISSVQSNKITGCFGSIGNVAQTSNFRNIQICKLLVDSTHL